MANDTIEDQKERVPRSYRDPTIIRELKVVVWQEILSETNELVNIDVTLFSHESLVDFLNRKQLVSSQLVFALRVINELGDAEGRNLIEQAAADVGIVLESSDDETDRELAARVWLQSRKNNKYLDILNRAFVSYQFYQKKKNVHEYVGESSFDIESIDEEKIKKLVSTWCVDNGKSSVAHIYVYKADENWCCNIVRGDPLKREAVINEENKLDQLTFRPAACDHVRIDPSTGRIGILTRTPKLVSVYREVFGEVLTNNPNYFSGEKICSLEVLIQYGKDIFEGDKGSEIRSVSVKELKWQGIERDTLLVKGNDCFRVLDDLGIDFRTGELVEAKLSFELWGKGRPCIVVIKVPFNIEIPDEQNELVIERYLTDIGIRGRFDSDIEEKTLWEIGVSGLPETRWREYIGGDFDTLMKEECFKSVELSVHRHPDYASAIGDMAIERLGEDEYISVSENPDVEIRTLTPTDRFGYKLDYEKVSQLICQSLELKTGIESISKDILYLGSRELTQSCHVGIYLATLKPSINDQLLINQHKKFREPVLLIPDGCTYSGLNAVETRISRLDFDDLVRNIVFTLGIQDKVHPLVWAREKLILWPANNKAWYCGVEIEGVNFDDHDFKFALAVANSEGELVKKEDLNQHLSQSRLDDGPAKAAKRRFMQKINKSLKAAGKNECKTHDIIEGNKGGYRLKCSKRIL